MKLYETWKFQAYRQQRKNAWQIAFKRTICIKTVFIHADLNSIIVNPSAVEYKTKKAWL